MIPSILDLLFYLAMMTFVAVMGWLGQWGKVNKIARYVTLSMIGLTGVVLMALGGVVGVAIMISAPGGLLEQQGNLSPEMRYAVLVPEVGYLGWMFLFMGIMAIPSLIPPVRRFFQKTVFRGLDVDNPAHTWALYIFLDALVLTLFSITVLYNPEIIIESLKQMPLAQAAALNVLSFVVFVFVCSGIWIAYTPKEIMDQLGLTRLPWKKVFAMIGVALLLAVVIQGVEWVITPFVDPTVRETLQRVGEALQTHQDTVAGTLALAVLVGLCAGIGEEVLFRGLMQPVFGIIPTAILFTLIHTHYGMTFYLLELFLVGAFLGIIRKRYNTTAAIIVHAGFDFFAISSSLLHQ